MTLLRFEIAWDTSAAPRLLSLVDNGWEVPLDPPIATVGRLTVAWEADDRIPHMLIWDVAVDGAALAAVRVTAGWDAAGPQLLAQLATAPPRWSDLGVVRRRGAR